MDGKVGWLSLAEHKPPALPLSYFNQCTPQMDKMQPVSTFAQVVPSLHQAPNHDHTGKEGTTVWVT